jgi:hypothetical protein
MPAMPASVSSRKANNSERLLKVASARTSTAPAERCSVYNKMQDLMAKELP